MTRIRSELGLWVPFGAQCRVRRFVERGEGTGSGLRHCLGVLRSSGADGGFEAAYGADGAWTHLFRQAFGFIEVELLRCEDQAGRFLTIDRWESGTAFEDFRRLFAAEYRALDAQLEGLASTEVRIGAFEEWPFTRQEAATIVDTVELLTVSSAVPSVAGSAST